MFRNLSSKERWFCIVTENENIFHDRIYRGLTVYFSRIMPTQNIYEVKDLYVRTVAEDYFVATDKKDKHAFLFMYKDIEKDNNIFYDRKDAVKKVKEAEKNRKEIWIYL